MVSNGWLFPLAVFVCLTAQLEAADICEILDANYCFYFSDSSCYINLCQCEACLNPDKVQVILEGVTSSNSTYEPQEKLCPSWCSHLKSNETIVNILGSATNSSAEFPNISLVCNDLKDNCLAQSGYNGYCYFYEKNCEYRPEIARKGKAKKFRIPKSSEECLKHQKKCSQKYKRHYSCKTFRKYCRMYHLPELEMNSNSTGHNSTHHQVSTLEQCLNFQKICAAKYKKHFACRQFRKKCKNYSLPDVHFGDSEITQKSSSRHLKKHMRRGHGIKKAHFNDTVVIMSDDVQIGNETLVETILRRN